MTVKKATRCGGYAAITARQKLHNTNQQIDIVNITKPSTPPTYNIIVGFNEKDHLQLLTKEESPKNDDKQKLNKNYTDKTVKTENIPIDDINNCTNVENYPNCENTLVFYITKNFTKEAIALKFENNQDFKRIYFTYKYFKMRNRLTNNTTETIFQKKKVYNDTLSLKNRKNSVDNYQPLEKGIKTYDILSNGHESLTQLSLQKEYVSRFDQPMSLIGIKNEISDLAEIDSIIYTDVDIPPKPERKRLFQRSKKAPVAPVKDNKVLKGEFIRVNVERSPDIIPKDNNRLNKIPDILMFRDNKTKPRTSPLRNIWSANNKVTGYESDREEWRSSRSQFSTTAFDSLARPTKMAMALTFKKPQRLEPLPQYYRVAEPKNLAPFQFRQNNFTQRPPRLPRPAEIKRIPLNPEHKKFTSLQNLELPKKLSEPKKQTDKKTNYSTLSTRISGLTNKLRDLGNPTNTIGRFKAQSHGDVTTLKPVLKSVPDSKRPVVRTCSAEPPKKVTFSAFATVQVV